VKYREISLPAEQILASQVGLYSAQFTSEYLSYNRFSEREKNTAFRDMTLSSLVGVYRGFGGK
jgi:hypothetical protein